jgi:uncharacterized membrane protein
MALPSYMSPLDAAALVWFAIVVGGYRYVAGRGALRENSIVGAVQQQREQWMLTMARRDNRLMDAILLNGLSQGNAFFASTSAIAIGGLATLLGAGERARTFFSDVPLAAPMPAELYVIKLAFLIAIFVFAFFEFAWAFRLTHYSAIMIGGTPLRDVASEAERDAHALRVARLNGIMAEHANSGLRSFYYAIAAFTWFFHPLLFMAATTWVVAVLVRRDFFSRSRAAIAGID